MTATATPPTPPTSATVARPGRLTRWRLALGGGAPLYPLMVLFGLTVVSCEHGDIRQTPQALRVYGDDGKWEVPVAAGERGRAAELEELYQAVVHNRPVFHDGRWGEATLEVVLAIMQSARERRELRMSHQVPVRD